MPKQKKPTDFQDTPHDPEALGKEPLGPDNGAAGFTQPDPIQPATSDSDGQEAKQPDEPKEAPLHQQPRDPTTEAIDSITQNGLSDRRFAVRVRQVGAPITDDPKFAAAVDRELRLRLLARLEDFAER